MTLSLIDNLTSDVIPINRLPALIGRAPEADVPLDDERIGNLQCMVDRTWLGMVLWDMGTGFGTRVNGKPVMKAVLEPGDEICIGRFRFRVMWETPDNPRRTGLVTVRRF